MFCRIDISVSYNLSARSVCQDVSKSEHWHANKVQNNHFHYSDDPVMYLPKDTK